MKPTSLRKILAVGGAFALVLPATALAGETIRVNVSPAGAQTTGDAGGPDISDDGDRVTFWTTAADILGGDANAVEDVYVRKVGAEDTIRVSVPGSSPAEADNLSFDSEMSADGRLVAFDSLATNLAPDGNNFSDVFLRDTDEPPMTINTTRMSIGTSPGSEDGLSSQPAISGDGNHIAFLSLATNMVAGDTNGKNDVFVRQRTGTPATTRVSVNSAGVQGDGHSSMPSISADGRYVVFQSVATNLVAIDSNSATDIFLRDRSTTTTKRLSVNSSEQQAVGGGSEEAQISADGSRVVFRSVANNLAPGDTNGVFDIFVRDITAGTTTRVSVSSGGAEANGASKEPTISADGTRVAFVSSATNLVAGDTNAKDDIFVHDLETGETRRVSVTSAGAEASGASEKPSISGTGQFIAFRSIANDLVTGDTNIAQDIFRHDRLPIPPQVVVPANQTLDVPAGGSAVFNYTATATDAEGTDLTTSCAPASGSAFTVGTTTVNCSATDFGGQQTTESFTITITSLATPPAATPPQWNASVAVCAGKPPVRKYGKGSGKVNFSLAGITIEQRILSAALRRINAANAWMDAGIVPTDICRHGLGYDSVVQPMAWVGAAPVVVGPETKPRALKIAKSGKRATFTFDARQATINWKIARALQRRAKDTRGRFLSLTGGNLRAGTTLELDRFTPGLGFADGVINQTASQPAARLPSRTTPTVKVKLTRAQMLKSQRAGQAAIKDVNYVNDRISKRGLISQNFAPDSIGGSRLK